MKKTLITALLGAAMSIAATGDLLAQTSLRIFTGGQQRPDVMKQIVDVYMKRNPGVTVEVEVGGATSEQQQQYLNTVLASATVRSTCADRRDPSGPVGRRAVGRAPRQLSRRREGRHDGAARSLAYRELTWSTARSSPCPTSPTRSSSTTARICWRSTDFSPPKTWAELTRRRQEDHGRREEPATFRASDRRRADRRHRLHLPRAACGALGGALTDATAS